MRTLRDPATLTPDQVRAELSRILATAYRRLVIARTKGQNSLDVLGPAEPPCDHTVNGNAKGHEEVA